MTDKERYELLQQLLPACHRYWDKTTRSKWSDTGIALLRRSVNELRSELRQSKRGGMSANKYRYKLACKVRNALTGMGNLTKQYETEYDHNTGDYFITVTGKRKRRLINLVSGFKLLSVEPSSVVYAKRLRKATQFGNVYDAVIIVKEGEEKSCLVYAVKGSPYYYHAGSVTVAVELMRQRFTANFMERAELALAGVN